VAQFASFVQATGYITDAERQKQAAVFLPDANHPQQWWQLKSGYTWQSPNGPQAEKALPNEPVRFVTKNDAEHYAVWLGRDLPSEIEWEYAAKAGQTQDTPCTKPPWIIINIPKPIIGRVSSHFTIQSKINLRVSHPLGVLRQIIFNSMTRSAMSGNGHLLFIRVRMMNTWEIINICAKPIYPARTS
jgi:hypothetical protein